MRTNGQCLRRAGRYPAWLFQGPTVWAGSPGFH